MFEQNNIGVRLSNPITTFMQNNLQEEDVRLAEVADAVNCTFDLMDEEGISSVLFRGLHFINYFLY